YSVGINHMVCNVFNNLFVFFLKFFYKFTYFLFAPTLIYRDKYPRTKSIDWFLIIGYLIQCLSIVICGLITRNILLSTISQIGLKSYRKSDIFWVILMGYLIALQHMYTIVYGFFHLIQNIFAELLRFGDRHFYGPIWRTTRVDEFVRDIDPIVSNWIYGYIYSPFVRKTHNKLFSICLVFIISGIIHELIMSMMLGFLFPIMLLQLGLIISEYH
ncbi:sterol O-acyltransferase 2-like, partial [Oppia nitens]|uniref:sterol O-acyltransferase 2-like n=1 Tax=Oppia nitens TaxID=1686743 RepID=UPI0023DA731A